MSDPKPPNKISTKGVKRHRKWLKHLHGEGARIMYRESDYVRYVGNKDRKTPPGQAFLMNYHGTVQVRFVPARMAEQIWKRRRDK